MSFIGKILFALWSVGGGFLFIVQILFGSMAAAGTSNPMLNFGVTTLVVAVIFFGGLWLFWKMAED